jgi:hypothetical protein
VWGRARVPAVAEAAHFDTVGVPQSTPEYPRVPQSTPECPVGDGLVLTPTALAQHLTISPNSYALREYSRTHLSAVDHVDQPTRRRHLRQSRPAESVGVGTHRPA